MQGGQEIRVHRRVVGRVQGVGFRWWTEALAKELGLHGWVRNRPDGSVELQAAGTEDAIATLEARLPAGPASAKVDRVQALRGPFDLPGVGFEIRRD